MRSKKPKRSLARHDAREPLYIITQPNVQSEVPVCPRFKIRDEPEPLWATMVFTERRKADAFLAAVKSMNLDFTKHFGVGAISLRKMETHIRDTAGLAWLESQAQEIHILGSKSAHVDVINLNNEVLYPLVLSSFPKLYAGEDPAFPSFQAAQQALITALQRSRAR